MQLRSLFCAYAQKIFFLRTEKSFSSRSKYSAPTLSKNAHACSDVFSLNGFYFSNRCNNSGSLVVI